MADEGFTFSMVPRARIASPIPSIPCHFPDGGEDNLCAATGAGGEYGTEATVGLGKPLSE
jgi:hypothetical protein